MPIGNEDATERTIGTSSLRCKGRACLCATSQTGLSERGMDKRIARQIFMMPTCTGESEVKDMGNSLVDISTDRRHLSSLLCLFRDYGTPQASKKCPKVLTLTGSLPCLASTSPSKTIVEGRWHERRVDALSIAIALHLARGKPNNISSTTYRLARQSARSRIGTSPSISAVQLTAKIRCDAAGNRLG